MRYLFILIWLYALTFYTVSAKTKSFKRSYPLEILTNGVLKVTVLLPDAEHGYYRSTRFDWSGIIAQVEYDSHTYFQEWQDYNGTIVPGNHDPSKVGTGTGTAEEFRTPLGYDDASVGEPFLKIGVGILERESNKPYHFNHPYKMIEIGKWKIKKDRNSIRFIQEIITDFGYAYRYEKIIMLKKDKPEIEIIHSLKNIGEKDIHANPYCHNFFQFDNEAIGTDYKIEFPGSISTIDTFDSRTRIQGNGLQLNIKMEGNEYVGGHIEPADAKEFVLTNAKTKTSVEVISDVIPGPFYLYITKLSFCPEPMILFDIEPGESYNWSRCYRFYK